MFKRIKKSWALKVVLGFVLISIFHPFIANEKPIYCKIDGKSYFPILKQISFNIGLSNQTGDLEDFNWKEKNYEFKVMPIIPYSYNTIDKRNSQFRSPFSKQDVDNIWQRHWLGTDILGRDVAAGVLKGAEVAMLIGFFSLLLATTIALILGLSAAYYKRFPLKTDPIHAFLLLMSFLLIIYYIWLSWNSKPYYLILALILVVIINGFYAYISKTYLSNFKKKVKIRIPIDSMFLRILEAMKSIPALIFLLACASLFESISIKGLTLILAFIMWPGISRYVRAEAMKIMNLDYIEAAKAYGASTGRILIKHVVPKLFTSMSVIIAFGISAAIMMESTLSFLGIGISIEQVSWGSMLKEAKVNFSAWWLAIFPGIAMFLLILSLNVLGEKIESGK